MHRAVQLENLATKIIALLKEQSLQLSIAESFTGGGVANAIVLIEGASAVFYEGLVCYNSRAKAERLAVNRVILEEKGAVNAQIAKEMVLGLLLTERADIAVATTGIAGSGTDAFHTPVGRAYIACGMREDIAVHEFLFEGNRRQVIESGIEATLKILYEYLLKREGIL